MLGPVNTSSSNKCFSRLQRAYYFSEEALLALFKGAGLECTDIRIHARELENRARKVVMNRCVQRALCNFLLFYASFGDNSMLHAVSLQIAGGLRPTQICQSSPREFVWMAG
jgi:hypothetical protein